MRRRTVMPAVLAAAASALLAARATRGASRVAESVLSLLSIGAAIAATAVVVLLAAGCGGSTGSHVAQVGSTATQTGTSSNIPGASTQESGALGWTHCMRSHGVLNLADQTGSNVKIPSAQQLGVSGARLQAAENDCKQLLPNGGRPPNQAEQQQLLSGMRRFAECMRARGVPDWPDPTIGPQGKPGFDLLDLHPPLDPDSPQAQRATRECGHLVPKALGGIPVERANP